MIKSFTYIFKEKAFLKHFFMLFLFVLVSNFITNISGVIGDNFGKLSVWYYLVLILGYVVMFIPYGYSMELLRLNLQNKDNSNCLDLDILKNFKDGFIVLISGLLLLICLFVLFVLLGFMSRLFFEKFGILGSSFVLIFVFLIFFIMSFIMIAMCCRYVIKPNWLNFLNFKAAINIINNNVVQYFKVYLLSIASMIVLAIITVFLSNHLTDLGFLGFLLYNLIVSLLWTYLTFVFAKLFAYAVDVEKI